jgi:hypothetical protein
VAFGCPIEKQNTLCGIVGRRICPSGDYPNHISCRNPLDLIAGANAVSIGDGFRHRNLKLRRDLRHTRSPYYSKDCILAQRSGGCMVTVTVQPVAAALLGRDP